MSLEDKSTALESVYCVGMLFSTGANFGFASIGDWSLAALATITVTDAGTFGSGVEGEGESVFSLASLVVVGGIALRFIGAGAGAVGGSIEVILAVAEMNAAEVVEAVEDEEDEDTAGVLCD